MLLSSRKQFPPSDNPWKHIYDPEDRDAIDFKMWNSLIGVILVGTVMGWSASTYVPLLPGWLGALGTASFLGYSGTLKDSRGDVLRQALLNILYALSLIYLFIYYEVVCTLAPLLSYLHYQCCISFILLTPICHLSCYLCHTSLRNFIKFNKF